MNVSPEYRYALYCEYCETVKVAPMAFLEWLARY
jgi:hypothetical protein